ncbi:hypothetical protein WJX72_008330 [[Myrmecia] bisecta]|uniref:Uncharacterized protein n=1 Tax=[Myrmecia] bisecta TaxID=41462 RepID=A0AAW1Q0C9_9CHLO
MRPRERIRVSWERGRETLEGWHNLNRWLPRYINLRSLTLAVNEPGDHHRGSTARVAKLVAAAPASLRSLHLREVEALIQYACHLLGGQDAAYQSLLAEPQPEWLNLGAMSGLRHLETTGVHFLWLPVGLRAFKAHTLALHEPLPSSLTEYQVSRTDNYEAAVLCPDMRLFGMLPLRSLRFSMSVPGEAPPNNGYITDGGSDGTDGGRFL